VYGLKYLCEFDPISDAPNSVFKIEILQKDYTGQVFNITGSTIPALQQWATDDPKAPIKGSSLAMAFINKDGNLPLSSFFSTDDDDFKVIFSVEGQVLFIGYLVQDDCSETLVDYTHEINLSANDSLGLLKDVSLDKANVFSLFATVTHSTSSSFVDRDLLFIDFDDNSPIRSILVGDKIKILDSSIAGTYTVNKVTILLGLILIYVDEPLPPNYIGDITFQILKPANMLDKTPLSNILKMCLSVTGLDLNIDIYGKIIETTQDASKSFLEQTLIDPQTFLKSDTEWSDCYDVLEKIMARFNMSIFQANGVWNIIRWDELRYYDNLIEGFRYDKDFAYVNTITKSAAIESGPDKDVKAETGILQKISRPFLFDKETFNYQYPRQLLRNFDLKQLGSLIRTYTTGSGNDLKVINEYNAPWWYESERLDSGSGTYFIRVTSDYLDNEIERTLVVTKDVRSYQIEVNKGDSFKYSFSFKTQDSQSGVVTVQALLALTDGIKTVYFHNPAKTNGNNMWQSGIGFAYDILSGDNTNQWHTIEMDSSAHPFPFDGLVYCYLRIADLRNPIHETFYKDIRFEYTARINESTKIIGQTHTSSQAGTIKNVNEEEIFIDSSPRNSISGTLFLNEKIGLLQKRTSKWKHPYLTQSKNLGDLMTFEQMFWRHKPRTILEGTLYGAISGGSYISLLSVIKYDYFPDLNFVFGKLEIDYRNNKFDCTLWEMSEDNEPDVNIRYKFDYLYSTE
jgi:hypothetical protein